MSADVVSTARTLHVRRRFEGDGLCDVESKVLWKPILHGDGRERAIPNDERSHFR